MRTAPATGRNLMLRKFVRRACAALGLSLALVAAPAPAKTAQAARPALWAVSDADTTIYLFGTIHLLPDKYQWRTAKFDQAIQGSQQLVVETIVDNKNPQQLMAALASLAFNTPHLPPLAQRVPPAKRAALAPELKQALIKQRNANWSKWIQQRMTQPGEIMIAVGAGHLAGPDSVIALLQRDGYRVRRVQ